MTTETTKRKEQINLLKKSIGAWVRLQNVADVEMVSERVTIHIHGKLDYTEDDQTYCVCTQDAQGHGTNSVSFQESHIEDCFRQPSGIVDITLF